MAFSKSLIPAGDALQATSPPLRITLADLCIDVLLMICDCLEHLRSNLETPLKCLILVNRRLHSLLAPQLFRTLHIKAPIKLLRENSRLYCHANSLKVDMFGSTWWWCSGVYVSDYDAVDLFRFIHKLEFLTTLEVSMMSRSTDMFTTAFQNTKNGQSFFVLEKIETLVISSSAAFLACHCPRLKSLVIEDGGDCLVEKYSDLESRLTPLHPHLHAGLISNLTHFEATAIWSVDELRFLTMTFPQLQCLQMRSEMYCYRTSFTTIMRLLGSSLKDLRILKLHKIGNLDVGFRSVWKRRILECKTESLRKALWRENESRRVAAENRVVRVAFADIGGLKEIWIGDSRVARRTVVYGYDNNEEEVGLRWMWERRREALENCVEGSVSDKYKAERDEVVVQSELGM